MKTIHLHEAIEKERQRVAEQLKELREQNARDTELLKSLKEEYSKTVFDSDIAAIDELNTQIKDLTMIIQDRKEMIDILSDKKNPVIQRAVTEAARIWKEELDQIDKAATTLFNELAQHHQKVVTGLEELQQMREQAHSLERSLVEYVEMLNDESRQSLGLPKHIYHGELVDIRKYMDPLLITHYVRR